MAVKEKKSNSKASGRTKDTEAKASHNTSSSEPVAREEVASVDIEKVSNNVTQAEELAAKERERENETGLSKEQIAEMDRQHRDLVGKFLGVCRDENANPAVAIASCIAAAATIADNTMEDTTRLENYLTHCFADALANIQVKRGVFNNAEDNAVEALPPPEKAN